MTSTVEADPFNSLLTLEDQYYQEGYHLGISDGSRAGLIDGRLFGLERGFEKCVSMGKLFGRAVIWTGRLPVGRDTVVSDGQDASDAVAQKSFESNGGNVKPEVKESSFGRTKASRLPVSMRLEKHVRTLYALTEPDSLSTANDENSVSEFDDRFKRAEGKTKVIEKLTDEMSSKEHLVHPSSSPYGPWPKDMEFKRGADGIEDMSALNTRQ